MQNEDSNSFLATLVLDVDKAMERQQEIDDQATRRDLVRTVFAAIDGIIWVFREEVTAAAQETYGLEHEELQVLEERTYSITKTGRDDIQSGTASASALANQTACTHCGSNKWKDRF